jgi:hypothetical protein
MDGAVAIIVSMLGLGLMAVLFCQYNLNQAKQRQRFKDEARFYRKVTETLQNSNCLSQLDLGRIVLEDVARRQNPTLTQVELEHLSRIINGHLKTMQRVDSMLSDYRARRRRPTCSTDTMLETAENGHRKLH